MAETNYNTQGHIQKTHTESYFRRFHLNSRLAEKLFEDNADEIILQMIICGEMEVIAEIVKREKMNND